MSTGYPRSLSFFTKKISNYSRNTFKLTVNKDTAVGPGGIIQCELPSNALLDLETLCMHFKLTTTGTTQPAGAPKHIESLIDKISVEIGNKSIASCSSLNHVYQLLLQYQNSYDLRTKRTLYQYGAAGNVANQAAVPCCIHSFLGLISSCSPSILDSALLGDLKLTIHLAPSTILPITNGCTAATYSLDNVFFTCDTISIDDGIFYNLHSAFLESGGLYEIPFQSIYTSMFSLNSATQSSRMTVHSSSIDMLAACPLPYHGVLSQLNATTHNSGYFTKDSSSFDTYQFEVNGVASPTFNASVDDCFSLTLNALAVSNDQLGGIDPDITSQAVYKANYWAPFIRLNHPTPDDERFVSGINSLGNSASIVFRTTALSGAAAYTGQLLVVAFCTSVLRVGAGRTVEIIQ